MKKLKCPICGSKRTFLDIIPQGYQYICTQCGLCALRQFTPQEAAEAWNELVSKFPPIMRLQIGDELVVNESNSGYHYFRVTEIYRNESTFFGICLKTNELEQFKYEDVSEWPWELEQK
jgi:hypothetical protein